VLKAPLWIAVGVAILSAIAPMIVCMSRFLMSELPYAALAMSSILVLDCRLGIEGRRGNRQLWWAALAGVLICAAVLTRAVGLSLAGAGVAVLLVRRRWGAAAVVGGI